MIGSTERLSGRDDRSLIRIAGARRMVGAQREYCCDGCGAQRRSWVKLERCMQCGDPLTHAVIVRAALA